MILWHFCHATFLLQKHDNMNKYTHRVKSVIFGTVTKALQNYDNITMFSTKSKIKNVTLS